MQKNLGQRKYAYTWTCINITKDLVTYHKQVFYTVFGYFMGEEGK